MIGRAVLIQQTKPKYIAHELMKTERKIAFDSVERQRIACGTRTCSNRIHTDKWSCSSVYFLEFCLRLYRDDWLIFHFNSIDAHKLKCRRMLRATLFFSSLKSLIVSFRCFCRCSYGKAFDVSEFCGFYILTCLLSSPLNEKKEDNHMNLK